MTTKTTVVTGTYTNGDTEATTGSIAKAVNDVTTAAATVISVAIARHEHWHGPKPQLVAVIVWTEQA
jgi:hypothetical protein